MPVGQVGGGQSSTPIGSPEPQTTQTTTVGSTPAPVRADGLNTAANQAPGARARANTTTLPAPDNLSANASDIAADVAERTGGLVGGDGDPAIALDFDTLTDAAFASGGASAEELESAAAALDGDALNTDAQERLLGFAQDNIEQRTARLDDTAQDDACLEVMGAMQKLMDASIPDVAETRQGIAQFVKLDGSAANDPANRMIDLIAVISHLHGGGPAALVGAMRSLSHTVKMMKDLQAPRSNVQTNTGPKVAGGAATANAIKGVKSRFTKA